ncbi:cobalamin biosynthesis protein, partial [uncultured Desulfovibrio sp.]
METATLLFLPAALLLDGLLGEPPAAWHPVCGMGRLALWTEGLLRRGPNGPVMFLRGLLACLLVVLPCLLAAFLLVLLAARAGMGLDCLAAVLLVSVCLAPRSLAE